MLSLGAPQERAECLYTIADNQFREYGCPQNEHSTSTHESEATLEWVQASKHRIAAAAIDERLQIDPTLAEVEVEIQVDRREQIFALIERLRDPDCWVRNTALAAPLRQFTLALPPLRSAREKEQADQRWWIDAAIQQIGESLSNNKKP